MTLMFIVFRQHTLFISAIAATLHYLFLVDFFVMLMFGIKMARSVLFVMSTVSSGSKIKLMCVSAWGVPAVLVGVSLAVKMDGYGNSKYCWLSIGSYLIWAFVGPALLVILVNIVILLIVLRTMFSTQRMNKMSSKEQVRTTFRSLCVILPVFGITWVFGALSINEDTVIFQYLFAVFNSLQGFLVFLFHCCFNKNIKEAVSSTQKGKVLSKVYSSKGESSIFTHEKTLDWKNEQRKQSGSTDVTAVDIEIRGKTSWFKGSMTSTPSEDIDWTGSTIRSIKSRRNNQINASRETSWR